MRILHVSEAHYGGTPNLVRQFLAEQVNAGDEVLLLAPEGFPMPEQGEMEAWRLDRRRPDRFAGALRHLRRTVREFQPDVVHLHSFVAGLVGRLPGVLAGVPIVYQPHAWSFDMKQQRAFGSAVRSWERWASRRTAMLVTNCEDEIAEGRSIGIATPAASVGVIIPVDHFHPVDAAERERWRAHQGMRGRRSLVCVGRLVRQKGQDLLVAEWERQRPADTELVLVGPGDTAALERLAPGQWGRTIRAVGEQADVRPWLWGADALVLPSRYETVALVVGEAMASSRPVVAAAVNGAAEVMMGGDLGPAGRVVPLGDMRALVREAEAILDDPALSGEMGRIGRRRAEEQFTPAAVGARLHAAYDQAIAFQRS